MTLANAATLAKQGKGGGISLGGVTGFVSRYVLLFSAHAPLEIILRVFFVWVCTCTDKPG